MRSGDELLVTVAQRLKAIVRDSDAVARLGGDEFVVVLTDLASPAARPAALVAAKIVEELGRSYQVLGHVVHSTPSIGIAVFPDDGADGASADEECRRRHVPRQVGGPQQLPVLRAADERCGRRSAWSWRTVCGRPSRAGSFELHYQPQIDLASNEIVGVEALVRWRHPELGLVAPLKFIALAEETGLIVPIGEWVLGEALRQLAEWRGRGMTRLTVSVNISAHQLGVAEFVRMVVGKLAAHGLPASALTARNHGERGDAAAGANRGAAAASCASWASGLRSMILVPATRRCRTSSSCR